MYIDNIISKYGIMQEIDRICNTTKTEYSYRDKSARISDALDWYFKLAFKSGKDWNFDDINETSAPIDTQNIVSGTNEYKFSDFTEKILGAIKLEILDSNANGLSLIPETMADLKGKSFEDVYVNAGAGTPTHYIKYGDFIYLRPNPNYSEADGLMAYFDRAITKHEFIRISSVTVADPGVFTSAVHGLSVNDTVVFDTNGTIITGIAVDTTYYIKTVGATTTFEVAATLGGTAIEVIDAQVASVSMFLKTNAEPGIPSIHHTALARQAALAWLIDNDKKRAGAVAQQTQQDERDIIKYFNERDKDVKKRVSVKQEDNR